MGRLTSLSLLLIFRLTYGACQDLEKVEIDTLLSTQFLRQGIKDHKANHDSAALSALKESIRYNPQNEKAFYYIGRTNAALDNYKAATAAFTKAIELDNHDILAYIGRAESRRWEKNLTGALEDNLFCLGKDSTLLILYIGSGLCYYDMNDFDNAIKQFSKGIKLSPQENYCYYGRASSFFTSARWSEAIHDYNYYFKLNGTDPRAFYFRGLSFAYLSEKYNKLAFADSAIADLTQFISKNKNVGDSYRFLGLTYGRKRDTLKSREYFNKALAQKPDDVQTLEYWAVAELNFHDFQRALDLLNRYSEKIEKPSFDFLYKIGIARAGTKDTLGALDAYDQALHLESSSPLVREARLKLLLGDKKFNELISKDISSLVGTSQSMVRSAFLYAVKALVEFRNNEIPESNLSIKKSLQLSAQEPIAYLVKALDLTKIKAPNTDILRNYDKAISIQPKATISWLMKASYLSSAGNKTRACSCISAGQKSGSVFNHRIVEYFCEGKPFGNYGSALDAFLYPYIKEEIVIPSRGLVDN